MNTPDWFYQNAVCTDGQGQFVVNYFVTKEMSDEIVRVCVRERRSGVRTFVPTKDFFRRFKPVAEDDIEVIAPARVRERLSLV